MAGATVVVNVMDWPGMAAERLAASVAVAAALTTVRARVAELVT